MNLKINTILLSLITAIVILTSCNNLKKDNKDENIIPTEQTEDIVKMHPIIFFGNRYVVMADFGFKEKVPLMVHGNATMYLMLTHEVAEKLNNGNPINKYKEYGYSEKGMGLISIDSVKIGNNTYTKIQNVPVFDWPPEAGDSAQGMIGTSFLKEEGARIDFVNEQMQTGVKLSDNPDKSLIDKGYEFTKFVINEVGHVYLNVYFEALQKEIPITLSTVSNELTLHSNLFEGKLDMKNVPAETNSSGYDSPSHTVIDEFIANDVRFKVNNIPMTSDAELHDFAKYSDMDESELITYGILGRDWMKKQEAVIDYANQILYYKTKAKKK